MSDKLEFVVICKSTNSSLSNKLVAAFAAATKQRMSVGLA